MFRTVASLAEGPQLPVLWRWYEDGSLPITEMSSWLRRETTKPLPYCHPNKGDTHTQGLRLEMVRTGDGANNLEMELPKAENRDSTLTFIIFY